MAGKSDDIIGNDAAAQLVGLAPRTWTAYRARAEHSLHPPPQPYRVEVGHGHALPVWRRSDLQEWAATRPGRGAPGHPRNRRSHAH